MMEMHVDSFILLRLGEARGSYRMEIIMVPGVRMAFLEAVSVFGKCSKKKKGFKIKPLVQCFVLSLFPECHIAGIMRYIAFSNWFL